MEKFLCGIILLLCVVSCKTKSNSGNVKGQDINIELSKLDSLLRDTAFAMRIAEGQELSYYTTQGQQAPAFFSGPDSLVKKSYKEEKIAINLAGFYAVECGIGTLSEQKGATPVMLLQKIVNKALDSNEVLLLNRFANATWKAGQPFRGLDRITRDNFTVAEFLNKAEIQKDVDQVVAAASMLLDSMQHVSDASREVQLQRINQLLKDKQYAYDMARHMEAAYYKGQNKPVPMFLSPKEDTMSVQKSAREEKIAINLAGFYALECGIGYLVKTQHLLPSEILKSITSDSISQKKKQLLERFANATWKAGQPFRSLDRITREIFMPFDLLPKEEIDKDWDQIKSAAVMVQKTL